MLGNVAYLAWAILKVPLTLAAFVVCVAVAFIVLILSGAPLALVIVGAAYLLDWLIDYFPYLPHLFLTAFGVWLVLAGGLYHWVRKSIRIQRRLP